MDGVLGSGMTERGRKRQREESVEDGYQTGPAGICPFDADRYENTCNALREGARLMRNVVYWDDASYINAAVKILAVVFKHTESWMTRHSSWFHKKCKSPPEWILLLSMSMRLGNHALSLYFPPEKCPLSDEDVSELTEYENKLRSKIT